ncbi:PREDICTED: malignant fibrous histiocytoma-amplified sequence 1 homolog [Branchiostoma belcheri]|uniref:Leucine-rich repeat protein SHOC-2 n=1 Tax=Branchiostoma belcheri TaxID=7741 RepID=A0A6P4XU04_BRABE|nr:PREDICTED: malignant fibrous histiocytoma-amplified sequence 1 homolog [Branchiostoma belcheri]
MGVDLSTYRARIGCFRNPAFGPLCCWQSCLLVWMAISQLMLKLAGDVEENPGPRQQNATRAAISTIEDRLIRKEWNIMGKRTLLTLDLSREYHSSPTSLTELPKEVFELKELEALDLRNNKNINISHQLIKLPNLKVLCLDAGFFDTVPAAVIKLPQLEMLILSNNENITLPDEMSGLTNLTVLVLDSCNLDTLPPVVLKLTNLQVLDLSENMQLSLPDELNGLINLKVLRLRDCNLDTVPLAVLKLPQLEELDLFQNSGIHLPDGLAGLTNMRVLELGLTGMETVPPAVLKLPQLEELDLSLNIGIHLPDGLAGLTNIRVLKLQMTDMTIVPPVVCRLIQLERLHLLGNQLQTLPAEIGQLTNVKHMDLSWCKLRTLPPEVWGLTQLEWLDLRSNQLQTLPAEIGQLTTLCHMDVSDNPLIKPPTEVCRQGIAAVRQYFDELARSEERISAHMKVVFLGETMAGKTSLVRTLCSGKSTLTEEEDRTHCVEITKWETNDNITFEVYDFGGHDVYHLTHQFFLTPDAFYLLLVNLQTYRCSEERYTEAVGFWLDTLNARVPGAVVSIVGSKKDLCRPEEVETKTKDVQARIKLQSEMWEKEQRQIRTIDIGQHQIRGKILLKPGLRIIGDTLDLCVSVKPKSRFLELLSWQRRSWVKFNDFLLETANNDDLFPTLKRILPRTWVEFEQLAIVQRQSFNEASEQTNETYFTVKLSPKEEIQQPTQHWLTMTDCKRMGQLAGLSPERLEPVLSYLQQVGTILRYTDIPELKDFVFHDPPALIELFKDLFHHNISDLFSTHRLSHFTSAQLSTFQSDLCDCGLIRKEVMTCLLPPNVNPDIITALMQHFGLCFEVQAKDNADPSKHTHQYKIPWYLHKQMPEELTSVWPKDVPKEQEQLQLMCNITGFCPRGLFQRFSVRIHTLVKDRIDWKDGVMAYRQDYPVLVCSKPVADDTYITIATRGRLDQADEMWGVVHPLLEVLVQLLQEWPGVLYSLHVTCAHCIKAGLDRPYQHELRDRTAEDGRDVRCPRVKKTASTSADLVYRPARLSVRYFKLEISQDHDTPGNPPNKLKDVKDEVVGTSRVSDELDVLKWLLTEVKASHDAYEDNRNRLASHVSKLGLTFRAEVPGDGNCMFHAMSDQVLRTEGKHKGHLQLREEAVRHLRRNPHNAHGDHFRNFISNQSWEVYLENMSRDGTWGDHVILQAMADMLVRDVIIVSSVEADNYVTTLRPQTGSPPRAARPLLLGHYAENHYASLDETQSGGKPVVLLVNDEFGTSKGGISTVNGQLRDLLTSAGAKVLITVLNATEEEQQEALKHGTDLVLPISLKGDKGPPELIWLTEDHEFRYPNLPPDISVIVGHADVTSTAARNIRKGRFPSAKFILFNHVMPEDTEHYKSLERTMSIGDKMKAIREDTEEADVVFSVGQTMHDYYQNQIRLSRPHHLFLPKPSDIFSQMDVTYVKTKTKVVLCVGRVKGVEKLKGYDLVAKAMAIVIERCGALEERLDVRLRVRGISAEDFPESKRIIQANIEKGTFHFTPLKYDTQEELSKDFQEAHLVLMPSRAEPFGLVGLEAIAAGVPVLVSGKSGLAEFLQSRGAEFSRLIVDIDGSDDVVAKELAERIINILKGGQEEFQAAKRLKDKLLASEYWNDAHRKFLEECGIPQ